MEEGPPGGNDGQGWTGLIIIVCSIVGLIVTLVLVFILTSNAIFFPSGGVYGTYQWGGEVDYSQEIDLDLVSAAMEAEGIEVRAIYFHEETWESETLFGDDIPGIDRTWNLDFNYNITIDIERYAISNDTLQQLEFLVDEQNGTIELLIEGQIYNNYYDDGTSPVLDMHTVCIMSPWSDYGIIFDGFPWEQIIKDEMPHIEQLIFDATGLELDSSEVRKLYS